MAYLMTSCKPADIILDLHQENGPAFDLIDRAEHFVMANIRRLVFGTGIAHEEVPEIPRAAVRFGYRQERGCTSIIFHRPGSQLTKTADCTTMLNAFLSFSSEGPILFFSTADFARLGRWQKNSV